MAEPEFKGNYARKQLYSSVRVIAWSHGSRFKKACRLVAPFAGGRLLDYGCGDGTFLQMVAADFPNALGVDASASQNADCASRLSGMNGLSFKLIKDLADPACTGSFNLIVCMEVLEHCPSEVVDKVIGELKRAAAPGAKIVVSVPIEIGPTVVFKQALRRIAGWRNVGDYKWTEVYSWGELWRSVFAGKDTVLERQRLSGEWAPGETYEFHTHRGFNWRALRQKLGQHFKIDATHFTPLNALGGMLSSQAWIVCTKD